MNRKFFYQHLSIDVDGAERKEMASVKLQRPFRKFLTVP